MSDQKFADLEACIAVLIHEMPGKFTSHQLILRLAQKHQHVYIKALHDCLDSDTPFQRLHQWISSSLNKYPMQLVGAGAVSSHDIFGNANACSSWEKVA